MAKSVELKARVDIECPPNVSGFEITEAALQAFIGWMAALNGWRARRVLVECGTAWASYEHNSEPAVGTASATTRLEIVDP